MGTSAHEHGIKHRHPASRVGLGVLETLDLREATFMCLQPSLDGRRNHVMCLIIVHVYGNTTIQHEANTTDISITCHVLVSTTMPICRFLQRVCAGRAMSRVRDIGRYMLKIEACHGPLATGWESGEQCRLCKDQDVAAISPSVADSIHGC